MGDAVDTLLHAIGGIINDDTGAANNIVDYAISVVDDEDEAITTSARSLGGKLQTRDSQGFPDLEAMIAPAGLNTNP